MSLVVTLLPPIDPVVEEETLTWDFAPGLAAGTIIQSVEMNCVAFPGPDADPDADSRLIGSPVITASPGTPNRPNQAVMQLVGTMVAGVNYQIQCVAEMSDGQTLSLRCNLACATPPVN